MENSKKADDKQFLDTNYIIPEKFLLHITTKPKSEIGL